MEWVGERSDIFRVKYMFINYNESLVVFVLRKQQGHSNAHSVLRTFYANLGGCGGMQLYALSSATYNTGGYNPPF